MQRHKKSEKTTQWIHWVPITIIIAALVTVYVTGIYHYFSFHTLKQEHEFLKAAVANHPYIAPLIYMGIFAIATGISLPVADLLAILGGFLFPFPWNLAYVVLGATSGGMLIFLAARTAIQEFLKKILGHQVENLKKYFARGGWCYLLFMRFIPIFPFWFVNLVCAVLGFRFWTFVWTTVIGMLPISYIHVEIGAGLHTFLDNGGDHFSLHAFFNPQMRVGLILLGVISLLPLCVKKYLDRRK